MSSYDSAAAVCNIRGWLHSCLTFHVLRGGGVRFVLQTIHRFSQSQRRPLLGRFRFQPGEGPSRGGLLRDCENRWIVCSTSYYIVVTEWRSVSFLSRQTLYQLQLLGVVSGEPGAVFG